MFRTVNFLLCVCATLGAPPTNSDITYVKIQPITSQDALQPPHFSLRESRIENLPLTIRNFHEESIRKIRSDELQTTISDTSEAIPDENLEFQTESIETKQENPPEIDTGPDELKFYEKQVPGPRFYSKLSYFSKPREDLDSSLLTNLVSTRGSGRKKFRSKCRCERIWNCPKLQITVPRCPEEYFLCCF